MQMDADHGADERVVRAPELPAHLHRRYDREFRSIPDVVRVNAGRFPDTEAVVDGALRWTFADLDAAVLRAVRAMIAAGVRPGDRVGLWAPNSARWILAALAVQGAGGVLVPLNTRFKGEEAAYVLAASGARALVTVTDFLGLDLLGALRAAAPDAPVLEHPIVLSGEVPEGAVGWADFVAAGAGVAEDEAVARIAAVGGDDVSDIMFTSGTTGRPKGVVLTHAQSLRAHGWYTEVLTFGPGDRYLIIPPFFHTFGYKAGWMACLVHGVTVHPVAAFAANQAARRIVDEGITILLGPPAVFTDLLGWQQRSGERLGLRVVMISAASVPPALMRRVRDEMSVEVLVSSYGLTECTSLATTTYPGIDAFDDVVSTVGRAALDVELRVVDDRGTPVPPGSPGELLVRGYNVMRGYWEDPAATAAAIDADGWLRTGDVVVVDERGFVRITDRKKDMYITGGFNVYPAEVELILGRHPDVAEVAVVGVPDERLGEVGAAFVVPRAGAAGLTGGDFRAWARAAIANYKVPEYVVVTDALPRNASMKVTKHVLRERAGRLAARADGG
jgi:acyl-CoA synthetase (AMP-forming)/AMP-acid ligase II